MDTTDYLFVIIRFIIVFQKIIILKWAGRDAPTLILKVNIYFKVIAQAVFSLHTSRQVFWIYVNCEQITFFFAKLNFLIAIHFLAYLCTTCTHFVVIALTALHYYITFFCGTETEKQQLRLLVCQFQFFFISVYHLISAMLSLVSMSLSSMYFSLKTFSLLLKLSPIVAKRRSFQYFFQMKEDIRVSAYYKSLKGT